jgi:hypothetical protein
LILLFFFFLLFSLVSAVIDQPTQHTEVHGGAKEVCLAFLADAPPEEPTGLTIPGSGVTLPPLETKKAPAKTPAKKDDHHDDKEAFDPEEQEKLRKSMRDFLAVCIFPA